MDISCGFLILVGEEVLIAKPFKNKYWNIPKGKKEEHETDLEAAIRETFEESNISITPDMDIVDLGTGSYIKDKDLHLFLVKLDDKPETECKSFFDYNGKQVPEMIEFKWIPVRDINKYVNYGLIKYLATKNIGVYNEAYTVI